MKEKRRYFRYILESPVIFRIGSRTVQGSLCDLSYLGIGGYASEKMEEGMSVEAEIVPGFSSEPLKFNCKVVYVKATSSMGKGLYRVGLEFVNTEKNSITYLMRVLQEQMSAEARKKGKFF